MLPAESNDTLPLGLNQSINQAESDEPDEVFTHTLSLHHPIVITITPRLTLTRDSCSCFHPCYRSPSWDLDGISFDALVNSLDFADREKPKYNLSIPVFWLRTRTTLKAVSATRVLRWQRRKERETFQSIRLDSVADVSYLGFDLLATG